jgi:hypothetical protein
MMMPAVLRRHRACHVAFRGTCRNDAGFRVQSTLVPEM